MLTEILAKQPAVEPALTMLASDYAQSNRLPDAVLCWSARTRPRPDNTQIIDSLGDLYIRSGNAQKALDLAGQTKGHWPLVRSESSA